MATDLAAEISLPTLPVSHDDLLKYISQNAAGSIAELVKPFNAYDTEMRKVFAQHPQHGAINTPSIVPIFAGHQQTVKIRARDIESESVKERESYIMPLKAEDRKTTGSPAIVDSLQQFKTQFSLFTESSLADFDWSNVVAAGSSVVTSLLPIPYEHRTSKRAMRTYYHEIFAPASDVDLFIYGLNEEEAIDKIRQIERKISDALLVETTTVRTKNAITIASQYPTRHIQIVLRIYKSVSEILTGFDVDSSCAAFDGTQVWASPRALAAYMTQVNTIDLTRRSPSYESRLSKYHGRGFEIYWPDLDRSRIDPTIFERSFMRTEGLARLLVLEKLPKAEDREEYLDQRRSERGRPQLHRAYRRRGKLQGNVKDDHEDEVAEWVDAEDVSDYHTFTIPYGPKFYAARIEKLLFTKDLLLNAEWNKPKDREVHLHRHPAFFGAVDDIVNDCCGFCPKPTTMEEEDLCAEEQKIYVSGKIAFIKDDPGRQTIGSFNPLSADDYTEMAYVGNTEMLCKAIVEGNTEYVVSWLDQEGNDPNTRDYTGRTPLHLAVSQSTLEVVQALIDHGARLVARLVDGRTALHIAAARGEVAMIKALLTKSAENEAAEEDKIDARRSARQHEKAAAKSESEGAGSSDDSDVDVIDAEDLNSNVDATTESSMVNIKKLSLEDKALGKENEDDPDFYDINVLAWDTAVSPLHLAIVKGHTQAVECLVSEFGADVLLPVKLFEDYPPSSPRGALLTLVLALQLPQHKAEAMARLLFKLGATCAQADLNHTTAFHACAATKPDYLTIFSDTDPIGVKRAINHPACLEVWYSMQVTTPLMSAINGSDTLTALRLLALGVKPTLSYSAWHKAASSVVTSRFFTPDLRKDVFSERTPQPIISAVQNELPDVALTLIQDYDVDVNTLSVEAHEVLIHEHRRSWGTGTSLLDEVQRKLKSLLEWKPDVTPDEPPKTLKADDEYLGEFAAGSYRLWTGRLRLENEKKSYKSRWEEHVRKRNEQANQEGIELKQAAVLNMIEQYRKLENVLQKRSAKSFYELHPEIAKPTDTNQNNYDYHSTPQYFEKVDFGFAYPGASDDLVERLIDMFEAAWHGDTEKLRDITLSPWTDSDGQQQPPVRIAVQDDRGLCPFSIAVMHGNLGLARTIMEIAHAQYLPGSEIDSDQTRTRIAEKDVDYDDSDNNDDESDVPLEREVIKNCFTIEDVGEVSMVVKSSIKPMTMLLWRSSFNHCVDTNPNAAPRSESFKSKFAAGSLSEPQNMLQWAACNEDIKALKFILGLGHEYVNNKIETDDNPKSFAISQADFEYAVAANSPPALAEIIKSTGAGVPLQSFAKTDGVGVVEKSKYYQGLTVRGSRRAKWIAQARKETPEYVEDVFPPLLIAAKSVALDSVEWLQSEAPLRCYREFEATHAEDKRLQALAKTKEGFIGLVTKFLTTRSTLALHCLMLGNSSDDSLPVLQHLLRTNPDLITARSKDGNTALLIAFAMCRYEEAKLLIESGADPTARDKNGSNILHKLLSYNGGKVRSKRWHQRFVKMLELVDKRLLRSLFTERLAANANSYTPLAQFLKQCERGCWTNVVTDNILRYSKGLELWMIDGEGSTCLHTLIARDLIDLVEQLVGGAPTLINRENSTGRTPYELVEDRITASCLSDPVRLPEPQGRWGAERPSVATREPSSFITKPKEPEEPLARMWKLMQETKAKLKTEGKDQRTLVTLNEANEVARRLAARERTEQPVARRREVYGQDQRDADMEDEVGKWLPTVDSYKQCSHPYDHVDKAESEQGEEDKHEVRRLG